MIKILIVDDEKGITDMLRDFFKEQGFAYGDKRQG